MRSGDDDFELSDRPRYAAPDWKPDNGQLPKCRWSVQAILLRRVLNEYD